MRAVHRFPDLGSTQAEGRRRAAAGAPVGTVLIAETQGAGEGRLDHRWASPPGGLYLSYLVPEPATGATRVPLAVALALREVVAARWGVPTRLRWPNDLWAVRGPAPSGKLAGVIADRVERAGSVALVLGIGVNVAPSRGAFPSELREHVATVQEWTDTAVGPRDLEAPVLDAVDAMCARLATAAGAAAVVAEGAAALEGLGREVVIDGRPAGRLRGLSADGGLLVDAPGGVTEFRAGTFGFADEPPR